MSGTSEPMRSTRLGVARDHAELARGGPSALVATALRTKSVHAREVLAELAWPGHTAAQVEQWAGQQHDSPAALEVGMDPQGVAYYGHVLAVQTGSAPDRLGARTMLEAAATSEDWALLPTGTREMLLHLRVLARDRDRALQLAESDLIRPDVAAAAVADLHNPHLFPELGPDPAAHTRWLGLLNAALHSAAVADIGVRPLTDDDSEHASPFDRLTAGPLEAVESDPQVSVLMSAYRPGPQLLVAARSVLAQTWRNLELLIIDDGSGPGYSEVLEAAAALDHRVRLIRKAVNGGTYRARNTGLRQAHGQVAAILDSDDWWHPQALELGLAPLLRLPRLLATRSEGVRVGEQLDLTRPGYRPRFVSAASLVFRITPVLGRIGFFDPTAKGADNEFALRMEAAFGPVIRTLHEVLTVVRTGETLSSMEFSNGWRHPARHEYKAAYRPWHEAIRAGRATAYLDDTAPRQFVRPWRWEKPASPPLAPSEHYDLCLAGDWRRYGGPQRSMLEELTAARSAGMRVAVMHLEALRFMTTKDLPLCSPVQELIDSGAVERIHPDDALDVDVMLVRYPPILQYPPSVETAIRVRHLLIVANQAPLEPDGRDQRYVVSDVEARAEELFGRPPTWLPQGPAIRRVLLEQRPQRPVATWDSPGLIDLDRWPHRAHEAPSSSDQDAPVVVGRYSRDDAIKFPPTFEELVRGYDFGPGYEVRMMGGRSMVERLALQAGRSMAELPDNWVLLPHRAVSVTSFLRELDFFVYLDNPGMHEAFGRVILEAAASGVLTIVHRRHLDTYGDTVDYALPGEAQELVAHYLEHPQAYRERVLRSRALVAQRYGHHGFVERLRMLVDAAPASTPARLRSPEISPSLELLLRAAPEGGVLVEAGADTQVIPVRVRSAADAGHADEVVAVWRADAEEDEAHREMTAWLRDTLAQPLDQSLPDILLHTAPKQVRAVLIQQDGLVHLAGRGTWSGVSSPRALLDLAGGSQVGEWDHRAWWRRDLPDQLSVRLSSGDRRV